MTRLYATIRTHLLCNLEEMRQQGPDAGFEALGWAIIAGATAVITAGVVVVVKTAIAANTVDIK